MSIFDPKVLAQVPFHFWTTVIFVFGCVVGSFLNVCIYRMPRGESIVHPPSHCPHCNYSIPWYLNIPLFTWVFLRGRCANCRAPISVRYFLVEFLTGLLFAACWLKYGAHWPWVALVYCVFVAGLVAAAFIDFEHYIIPDEITIGGIGAGIVCSFFIPELHSTFPDFLRFCKPDQGLYASCFGAVIGAVVIYGIVRLGKLAFGRHEVQLEPNTKIVFTESTLKLPGQEIQYGEIFYRDTDAIVFQAQRLELIDRCYVNVAVRLRRDRLQIGEETLDPEQVACMEAVTDQIVLPREAMGLGDVKFMAAFGAFLEWPAVFFVLAVSSFIGALAGITMIALKKKERYSQIPFGPYLVVAALVWIFIGRDWMVWWFR